MPKHLNENNSKLVVDLGSVRMKQTLNTIAKNTHHGTLTNLVKSVLHKFMEDAPNHLKERRKDVD